MKKNSKKSQTIMISQAFFRQAETNGPIDST